MLCCHMIDMLHHSLGHLLTAEVCFMISSTHMLQNAQVELIRCGGVGR